MPGRRPRPGATDLVLPANESHSCAPPLYRPESEWRTVAPPRAFIRREDWATAKPMRLPTPYPRGTFWRCACGQSWVYDGGWLPVLWWQWIRRRRLKAAERKATSAAIQSDPLQWAQNRIDEIIASKGEQ